VLPQIILLPGNMCDARLWRGSDEVIIQTLYNRGFGLVFDADLTQDSSIAAMAERALLAIQGPLLLIGFSMGAIVAVEMAVRAPKRIAGLVLAGYNATADLPERAAHRPVQQAEVGAGGLERVLVEELKPNYLAAQNRTNEGLLELLRDMGMGLGADVFIRQSEALRLREDRRAALPVLDIPVLYMCGAEDALCPPAWHRNWADQTRYARFEEISGAGHMLPLEAPAAYSEILNHWLTQITENLPDG
jgi:pimeloyl-ACP methyl ester carboxylesterase